MANHKGSEGTVKVGTSVIAELRSFSISEKADTIEDTTMGDAAKTFQVGLTEWEGSITCFWDETDATGQEAMTNGATVTLNLYPEGAVSGDHYATGSAIVTEVGVSSAHDGMVERTFSVKGAGALTWGNVV